MRTPSNLTKEEFKQRIIKQFKQVDSPIRYLMFAKQGLGVYAKKVLFNCTEFSMDVQIEWDSESRTFQILFIEFDPSEYALKPYCQDLSDTVSLWRMSYGFELVDIDTNSINFSLEYRKLKQVDYQFIVIHTATHRNHLARFDSETCELAFENDISLDETVNYLQARSTDKNECYVKMSITPENLKQIERLKDASPYSARMKLKVKDIFVECLNRNSISVPPLIFLIEEIKRHASCVV